MNNQINNSCLEKKIQIRQKVQNIQEKKVLDLCCGKTGEMYKNIWFNSKDYLGFDLNPHNLSRTIKGDNEKLIKSIDLSKFDVFDIDTYANPYKLFEYICRKREDNLEVILTDSMIRGYDTSKYIKYYIGFSHGLLRRFQIDVIKKIISSIIFKYGFKIKSSFYSIVEKTVIAKTAYIYLQISR